MENTKQSLTQRGMRSTGERDGSYKKSKASQRTEDKCAEVVEYGSDVAPTLADQLDDFAVIKPHLRLGMKQRMDNDVSFFFAVREGEGVICSEFQTYTEIGFLQTVFFKSTRKSDLKKSHWRITIKSIRKSNFIKTYVFKSKSTPLI